MTAVFGLLRLLTFVEIDNRQGPVLEIEVCRVVTELEVDAPLLPRVLGCQHHEIFDVAVGILDVVRHTAGAVGNEIAALEDGDPRFGMAAANLAGRAHSGGHSAHHQHPVGDFHGDLQSPI